MADQNSQHLMNEADLPENLQFVTREPLVAGSAAAPVQDFDRYQGAILSAPLGLDTDVAKSQLPGANPAYRLMPSSISGNPATNAAIQSTAAKTIAVTPGPSTSVAQEVTLDVPSIFTPVSQTVTLPGPLSFALAPQPSSYFLGVPPPGLSGLEQVAQNSGINQSWSVTGTPTSAASFGILCVCSNGGMTNPSGWTNVVNGSDGLVSYKSLTGTSPITVSEPVATYSAFCAAMLVFAGPSPSLVQSKIGSINGATAFTSANTAGNTLIVVVNVENGFSSTYGVTIKDSQNNAYMLVGSVSSFNGTSGVVVQLAIFAAANCAGGANTITTTSTGVGGGGNTTAMEFSPFASGLGIPIFLPLPPGPAVNLSTGGTGGVAGILGVLNGGTGSNLSGTGGTSQFLRQSTSGGNIDVIQPDFSDLAGATGKLATKYNGLALVSNGLPSEVAKVDLTNQSANIGATNLLASAAQQMYRVSAYVVETTADALTSTLPNIQIVYTDFDSNVSVTLDATPILGAAGLGQSGLLNANAVGTTATGVVIINPKAATAIQYQTVNYASGTPGTMKYAVHIKLEAL